MPGFQYKAVTADGEMVQGTLEGSDRQQVVEQLHALGHTPIRIDETAAPVRDKGGRRRRRRKRRLNEDRLPMPPVNWLPCCAPACPWTAPWGY